MQLRSPIVVRTLRSQKVDIMSLGKYNRNSYKFHRWGANRAEVSN